MEKTQTRIALEEILHVWHIVQVTNFCFPRAFWKLHSFYLQPEEHSRYIFLNPMLPQPGISYCNCNKNIFWRAYPQIQVWIQNLVPRISKSNKQSDQKPTFGPKLMLPWEVIKLQPTSCMDHVSMHLLVKGVGTTVFPPESPCHLR